MTYRQFLLQVRATPRDWFLDCGLIRRYGVQCPITALAKPPALAYRATEIGRELGLCEQTVADIVEAADQGHMSPRRERIRRDLLRACGLLEGG